MPGRCRRAGSIPAKARWRRRGASFWRRSGPTGPSCWARAVAFRFIGADAEIDLQAHHAEFARWRWATPDEALRLIVPFKRPVYRAVLAEFAPLLR
jgi:8-oxo-dGTP pyrophosphatase MutT (NUDIX family)